MLASCSQLSIEKEKILSTHLQWHICLFNLICVLMNVYVDVHMCSYKNCALKYMNVFSPPHSTVSGLRMILLSFRQSRYTANLLGWSGLQCCVLCLNRTSIVVCWETWIIDQEWVWSDQALHLVNKSLTCVSIVLCILLTTVLLVEKVSRSKFFQMFVWMTKMILHTWKPK